jgi:hypothetical protein
MRAVFSSGLLASVLLLASPAVAECPSTRGDLAPGELITGVDPPIWLIEGDGVVGVGDVIALLRGAVGLQEMRFNSPSPSCPPLPGDLTPGVLDESTVPPTWRPDPDGVLNVGDVISLQRAVVGLQQIGAGVTECVHELQVEWAGQAPRILTDRRCPVGISNDVVMTVVPFDPLSEEGFQIDRYTVTYENISRGGASEVGVDVPAPIDATLFLDPGQPTYMEFERLSILDEAAKDLAPLNTDFFYASGVVTMDATLTVFGHSTARPDAICVGVITHRFQVEDSGAGTDPQTDPDCLAETEAESP